MYRTALLLAGTVLLHPAAASFLREQNSDVTVTAQFSRAVGPALPDSTAFRLVIEAIEKIEGASVRADPRPLVPEFNPPISGLAPLEAAYTTADTTKAERLEVLRREEIQADSAAGALNCILNGLETPEQRATVRAECPNVEEHSGVAASLPWHSAPPDPPNGPVGRVTPWRVRVTYYGVSPTERGGWSMLDYYFAPGPKSTWEIVGRTTVLHAD